MGRRSDMPPLMTEGLGRPYSAAWLVGSYHILAGSPEEQAFQREALLRHDIGVHTDDTCIMVRTADYPRALRLLWEKRVTGWIRYRQDLIKHQICPPDEFDQAAQAESQSSTP